MRRLSALLALPALLATPERSDAQIVLTESERFSLQLSGYVRSLTGIHDAGYEPPASDRRSGFHGDVIRLKWRAGLGDGFVLDVHDRVQAQVSSSTTGFGSSVAGLGVSASPGRSIDLESVWIDDDRLRVAHDVDRLALTAYTSVADITLGRQAITWGTSLLFPVVDLWAQFSPFELDTEEKPGVDAVRVLAYPRSGLEVDAVVADRGSRDDVSAGVRATWSLPSADVYGAAGRLWEEALAAGGVTWLFDTWTVRTEAVVSRDLEEDRWLTPRATVGLDWIRTDLTVSAEYHLNGLGASDPAGYLGVLQGERFARGESYYLGRHYLGGAVSWALDDQQRMRLAGSALVNLTDPSGAFLPALSWDVGQSTRLSLGALFAFGKEPAFEGSVPRIRSEYGTYGNLGYAQGSVYF